jgi:hypothetical protein
MPHVRTRLQRHIVRTVVEYNLRTSVALMALAGHLKPDQAVLGSRDALLVNVYDNIDESRFVRRGSPTRASS